MRRRALGFDRTLVEREVSQAMGLFDRRSFELGGDRPAQDAYVLELAEDVLKRPHFLHQRASLGTFSRNRLEEVAEPFGLDARSMEAVAVLRRGDGLEGRFQARGVFGDEISRRRKEARLVAEPKPHARKRPPEGLVERVELLAKGLRQWRFVAASAESLRKMDGAASGLGLELRSPCREPFHLDLEIAGGVGRSRESSEPRPELLPGGAFQIAPVRPEQASHPPERDAKIVKGLLVVSRLEPSEGGIRFLQEAQTQVSYRLFGRPRQKTRGELNHDIEKGTILKEARY